MMTSSNGNIFRITGHLCGEFTDPRWIPHTKASDAELCFFDLRPNKRLSKQLWGWWFETQSRPLWCHRNALGNISGGWALCRGKWRWNHQIDFEWKTAFITQMARELCLASGHINNVMQIYSKHPTAYAMRSMSIYHKDDNCSNWVDWLTLVWLWR